MQYPSKKKSMLIFAPRKFWSDFVFVFHICFSVFNILGFLSYSLLFLTVDWTNRALVQCAFLHPSFVGKENRLKESERNVGGCLLALCSCVCVCVCRSPTRFFSFSLFRNFWPFFWFLWMIRQRHTLKFEAIPFWFHFEHISGKVICHRGRAIVVIQTRQRFTLPEKTTSMINPGACQERERERRRKRERTERGKREREKKKRSRSATHTFTSSSQWPRLCSSQFFSFRCVNSIARRPIVSHPCRICRHYQKYGSMIDAVLFLSHRHRSPLVLSMEIGSRTCHEEREILAAQWTSVLAAARTSTSTESTHALLF